MTAESYVFDLCETALCDRRGVAVMLRVYLDESGTHDGSPAVTVGAYTGRPKTWKSFTREWKVAKRPIEVFHATDCEALQGEFKGWTAERRNEYVANLLPVIARHEIHGNAIGINVGDYETAARGRFPIKQTFNSAYSVCVQVVVDNIMWQMERTGMNDAIAFIHEDNDYREQALGAFEYVKRRRTTHASKMTLTFASKEAAMPLQAADILAYEANKRLRDQSRPKRRSLLAMDPDGTMTHITGIDKSNVGKILARMDITQKEISLLGRPVQWLRSL